jgi:hypothetical protein
VADQPWIVGFAGTGEVTEENASALLDDWLPPEVEIIVPDKIPRAAKGLRAVVDWAEQEKIHVWTVDSRTLVSKIKEAANDGMDPYLVLLWDESTASEALLDEAISSNVPVKDLTRALDDLLFEDEDDESIPFEPDPEPEEIVEPEVIQAEIAGPADIPATMLEPADFSDEPEVNLGARLEEVVRAIVVDEMRKAPGVYSKTPVKEHKTVGALVNEDGVYRIATKGRPKKGETRVELTLEEARDAGLEI